VIDVLLEAVSRVASVKRQLIIRSARAAMPFDDLMSNIIITWRVIALRVHTSGMDIDGVRIAEFCHETITRYQNTPQRY
jgi:hypothetical protein